jgi:hypothetical protein
MGWKTDWLYKCIFEHPKRLWTTAQKYQEKWEEESMPRWMSPDHIKPPDYLLIIQYPPFVVEPDAQTAGLSASFVGPPIRYWIYDKDGLRPSESLEGNPDLKITYGMHYKVGLFCFSISADRKLVLLRHMMGPLYGEHFVYKVRGQGKRGLLEGAPGFSGWIS